MSDSKWMKWGAITVTIAGIGAALYLFFDVFVGVLLPFLLAFAMAALTHPTATRFAARTGFPRKAVAAVLTLLTLVLLGALMYLLCSRILLELQNVAERFLSGESEVSPGIARLSGLLRDLLARFSHGDWLSYFIEDPEAFLAEQARSWLAKIAEGIPAFATSILRALPNALFFLLVTLIACFYFSVEYETVTKALVELLPNAIKNRLPVLSVRIKTALCRYFKAYFLLFFITFIELTVGFLILRVEYVFLPAFLIAVLDILPIFGVGTALLPWSVVAFLSGDYFLGVGLIVLYVFITIVRQVTEPHFVGKSLGLHPILMLISFYAGMRLFGFIGILAGPLFAILLKILLQKEDDNSSRMSN